MKNFTRLLIRVVMGGVVLCFVSTVTMVGIASAGSTLERVKEQGYIRVAFANEAPYAYATTAGKLTGEAPEIARAIFKKMGIDQLDGVLTEWASLIPGLRAGRFDVITAGMFVLPKRCKQINFSEPTYGMTQALLVKKGNPKGINTYEDIARVGATLAVTAGGVEVDQSKDKNVEHLMMVPDFATGLAAVQSGRADAYALTAISIGQLVEKVGPDGGVERAIPFTFVSSAGNVEKGHGGFGFRKQDTALLAAFNKHLSTFIGSKEHLDIVKPFGFGQTELPTKTTTQLCAGN